MVPAIWFNMICRFNKIGQILPPSGCTAPSAEHFSESHRFDYFNKIHREKNFTL